MIHMHKGIKKPITARAATVPARVWPELLLGVTATLLFASCSGVQEQASSTHPPADTLSIVTDGSRYWFTPIGARVDEGEYLAICNTSAEADATVQFPRAEGQLPGPFSEKRRFIFDWLRRDRVVGAVEVGRPDCYEGKALNTTGCKEGSSDCAYDYGATMSDGSLVLLCPPSELCEKDTPKIIVRDK